MLSLLNKRIKFRHLGADYEGEIVEEIDLPKTPTIYRTSVNNICIYYWAIK